MNYFDFDGHLILPCTYDALKTKLRWNFYICMLGKCASEWS